MIARTLLSEPVLCRIDRATPEDRRAMRLAQANFFLPFDRQGIDPFTDLFPVTLLAEGTVRGTGGIRITGADCSTTVPGLYAAGDAATRELICGGFTGGGSHNAAWAMSSGTWAGQGAARYAAGLGGRAGARTVHALGEAGVRPEGTAAAATPTTSPPSRPRCCPTTRTCCGTAGASPRHWTSWTGRGGSCAARSARRAPGSSGRGRPPR
ncbi:hypothetical protein ACFQY7_03985 [Actinomadura luteofluorescens]|uniref:hypothetical protein n=1 Tax=Actinomadura luteofluorescens TaxID=46163 RepID=UPI00363FD1B3